MLEYFKNKINLYHEYPQGYIKLYIFNVLKVSLKIIFIHPLPISPHEFTNIPLQSGGWDKNNIQELYLKKQKYIKEFKENVEDFNKSKEELNFIKKVKNLEDILSDKTKNEEMKNIMEFYESYFDEESGNTRQEGIDQLKDYLDAELKTRSTTIRKLKQNIDELDKEINSKKEAGESAKKEAEKATEENKNIFIPIIPTNITIIFRVLLAIFSFSIYFEYIDFNVMYLIFNIPEIVIPTIITSVLLFL